MTRAALAASAPKSEAHRQIAALVTSKGPAWLEKKLGLGEGTVRSWVLRGRVPQKRIRERVAEHLGIAEALWTTPVGVLPKVAHERGGKTGNDGPERTNGARLSPKSAHEAPPVPPEDAHDPKANAVATLRILRVALERAEPDQIPSLANAVTSSSRLLARLSGHLDVTEAQILRSGAWARLVKIVRDVLQRHSGAAAELDKALAEYEARA